MVLHGAGAERELPRESAEEHHCQAKWKLATRESFRFHRRVSLTPSCLVGRRPSLKVTGSLWWGGGSIPVTADTLEGVQNLE